jgi:hypothetical protein
MDSGLSVARGILSPKCFLFPGRLNTFIFTNQNTFIMKPTAPTTLVWILALIVGILGIIGHFVSIEGLSDISFWLLLGGFVLLALGTSFKNL